MFRPAALLLFAFLLSNSQALLPLRGNVLLGNTEALSPFLLRLQKCRLSLCSCHLLRPCQAPLLLQGLLGLLSGFLLGHSQALLRLRRPSLCQCRLLSENQPA